MNDYHNRLERAIDRRLKALPELPAPHGLVREVIALLERRARLPWYARPLMHWPRPFQFASLAIFLAVLGNLMFITWRVGRAEALLGYLHQMEFWFTGLGTYYRTFAAVGSSAGLLAKQVGIGFWIGCLMMVGMAYAVCLALGTFYFRLGYARR
jgi:hypothetical protein